MKHITVITALAFAALALTPAPDALGAQGQGRGQAKGQSSERPEAAQQQGRAQQQARRQQQARGQQGKGREDAPAPAARQGQARGQQPATKGRGRAAEVRAGTPAASTPGAAARARARFNRDTRAADMQPAVRRFATSNRPPQAVAAGAVARGHARGLRDDFRIVPAGDRVQVTNRRGDVLVVLDEDRARNLGRWQVDVLDTPVRAGSPAFCRSGAGHPVWGRQWCLSKGFGLGDFEGLRLGRTTRVEDIIFRRPRTGERLVGDALRTVLGNTAFDRLALHAVTLGFTDPLTGRWASDPDGGRVLLVDSGGRPVAEIVDADRNDRADLLLVALRPW